MMIVRPANVRLSIGRFWISLRRDDAGDVGSRGFDQRRLRP